MLSAATTLQVVASLDPFELCVAVYESQTKTSSLDLALFSGMFYSSYVAFQLALTPGKRIIPENWSDA